MSTMSNFTNRLLDLTCGQVLAISLLVNAAPLLALTLTIAVPQPGEIECKAEHLQQLRNERN